MRISSAQTGIRRRRASLCVGLHALVSGWMVLSCGCQTVPSLSHEAVLTPAEQMGIGAVAVSEILGTSQLSQDPQQIAATTAVGQRLAHASGRDDIAWDFKVVQHDRPFAIALPDGTVLITDSQLARCRSEADLAAVLAKEMGYMLAGVYPREVVAPPEGDTYVPINLAQLTPADQSAERAEDVQAADSIGLSLLVSAGYDPNSAMVAWLPQDAVVPGQNRRAQVSHRRNSRQEQSFTRSLTQARTIYQSQSSKLGSGQALAFTVARPQPQTELAQTPAIQWVVPPSSGASAVSTPAPRPAASGSNVVEYTSDGEFLPPKVASGRPGDGNWAAAPETTVSSESTVAPRSVQPASFEQFDAPAAGPALP